MTPDLQALARELVALEGWRWVAGMRTECGLIVYAEDDGYPIGVKAGDIRARPHTRAIPHDALPDLTDPATAGLVLQMVPGLIRARFDASEHVVVGYRDKDAAAGERWVGASTLGEAAARACIAAGRCA